MTAFRDTYDEADLAALCAEQKFVVAVDAYRSNVGTLSNLMRRAFPGPPYLPRGLGSKAFVDLVFEVARRIDKGRIVIEESWKREFDQFYLEPPEVD